MALALAFTVSVAFGQARGKGAEKPKGAEERKPAEKAKPNEKPAGEKPGEKPAGEGRAGNKAPGGAWSESKRPGSTEGRTQGAEGKNKSQATGAEGAAAERAAGNKNAPAATGKEGAAAGAAAANRNKPATSGAAGAAAGAAAANRNKPAASGAEGAVAGAAVANRNKSAVSGAAGAAAGTAAVRNSFDHPSVYNRQWYAEHQGAWSAPHWASGAAWSPTTAAAVASFCGYANNTAVSYGYGNNVTYQNGNVFVDGENVGTGEVFSQQAADLALVGLNAKTADSDKWLPLGVFALVRNEDQHPQLTLQLAINQEGILRGNYTDLVSDNTLPIQGAVDKETQRAAWTVGSNKNFFMEAGVKNLTDGDAPALIHKYGKTELWLLVRLPQPDQN